MAKGVRVLCEVLAHSGIQPRFRFRPTDSGSGHWNRVHSSGHWLSFCVSLFRSARWSEMLQSLSVGGVDGTTRNRFRGFLGRRRVRAKTGTLTGVPAARVTLATGLMSSCSRSRRRPPESRRHQRARCPRSSVNAMMCFVRRTPDPLPGEDSVPGNRSRNGDESQTKSRELSWTVARSVPALKGSAEDMRPDDANVTANIVSGIAVWKEECYEITQCDSEGLHICEGRL